MQYSVEYNTILQSENTKQYIIVLCNATEYIEIQYTTTQYNQNKITVQYSTLIRHMQYKTTTIQSQTMTTVWNKNDPSIHSHIQNNKFGIYICVRNRVSKAFCFQTIDSKTYMLLKTLTMNIRIIRNFNSFSTNIAILWC